MPSEISCAGLQLAIADYTQPGLIVPQLRASDPAGAIEELTHRLGKYEAVGDVLSFYHAAINQEFLTNSALPGGIAIPHARSHQVSHLTFAVGRTAGPVIWKARGARAVELVFLLAVPSTAARDYLVLLSAIVGLSRQPQFLARLRAADNAPEIYGLLQEISLIPA